MEEFNLIRIEYASGSNSLEVVVLKPEGKGPFSSVVYIHGHNPGSGAWNDLLNAYFLAKAGYIAICPSQVGYGLTEGKRDFCGPATVKGIIDGVSEVIKLDFIDNKRMGIWSVSRGATVTSQIITQEPNMFKAAVLQSGVYDMKKEFNNPNLIEGIKENMINETLGTDKAWEERSSIINADKIIIPVLILHGRKDENVSVEQAELLDKKLNELNKTHETVIIDDLDHYLTKFTRRKYTFPFLDKYLKV